MVRGHFTRSPGALIRVLITPAGRIEDNLRGRAPAIDGLRALAVLLLVFGHYAEAWQSGTEVGDTVVPIGYSVVVLFVLSGFTLTWWLVGEFERDGAMSLSRLVTRKALRSYPTLFAFAAFTTAYHFVSHGTDPVLLRDASILGLGVNYYNALTLDDPIRHNVGHLWSVAVGAHFTLVWAVVLRRGLQRGESHGLIAFLLVVITASVLLRLVLYPRFTSFSAAYLYNATETRVDQMAIGSLGALALRFRPYREALDRILSLRWLSGGTLLLLLLSVAQPMEFANGPGHTINALLTLALLLLVLAHPAGIVGRALSAAPLTILGTMAYSMFVWHRWGLSVRPLFSGAPLVLDMALTIGVTLAGSGMAYWVFERPFRRRANKLRGRGTHEASR